MKKLVFLLPVLGLFCGACDNSSRRTSDQVNNETSADWTITTKVKSAILADSSIAASSRFVSVDTHNGIVTLTGTVNSGEDADRIVRIVKQVYGVRGVDNRMSLKK